MSTENAPVLVQPRGHHMNAAVEKQIGKNIRLLREKAKMTQEELSAKLQLCG